MRIGEHLFYQPVATPRFRIRDAVKDTIALRVFDQMIQITLFLVAKGFSIADEKLKIACARLIDMWIVDLVDDSVTEGEAETATGMVGCTDACVRPRSPARVEYGVPKRL